MIKKCYWCGQEKQLYAFNLCHSCYRWFYRHIGVQPEYCSICDKYITKRQRGTCKQCRQAIRQLGSTPKRITHLEEKYRTVEDVLKGLGSTETACSALLNTVFKPKQKHLLDIICARYYQQKTMSQIAEERNVSREYIRQCEDRGIKILQSA